LTELARTGLLLAAVGGSLGLAVSLFGLPPERLQAFLERNELGGQERWRLVLAVAAGALLPVLAGTLVLTRGRGAALPALARWTRILSPLLVSAAVPALGAHDLWARRPLPYLLLLAAVVLLAERLLRLSLEAASPAWAERRAGLSERLPPRLRAALPLALVTACGTLYAVVMGHQSILRHHRLETAGFDLGIFDQLQWNAAHGEAFRCTIALPDGGSFLAIHALFFMFLFVPLYRVLPAPETLLALQSLFIGLAAVPLFLFASLWLPRLLAVLLALAYLLYAPLHGPNLYDFHWLTASTMFLFWMSWAIATRRLVRTAVTALVLLSIREDVAVGLFAVGAFLLLTGARARLGAALATVSLAWFGFLKLALMPAAGPWWFSDMYRALAAPGEEGMRSVVRTLLVNPVYTFGTLLTAKKLAYALHLLAPLALLPVRRPALLLLAVPGLSFTLLTTGYDPTVEISFQYTAHWIPYLFAAAVLSLADARRRSGPPAAWAAALALFLGVAAHSFVFGAVFQRAHFVAGFSPTRFGITDEERETYTRLRAVVARIPTEASVAATEREVPHVSARRTVFSLKISHGDADYLLVHRRRLHMGRSRAELAEALAGSAYGLVVEEGPFLLFRKGHVSTATAAAVAGLDLGPRP
jgi:uncharacterized membrane protein